MNGKVLVLGASGFVGQNVCNILTENRIDFVQSPLSSDTDLRDSKKTADLLSTVKPSIILNFAANVGGLNYVIAKAADVINDNAKMVLSLYESVALACPDAIVLNPIGSCTYPGHLSVYNESDWQNGGIHQSVLSYGSARRFTYAVGECYKLQYGIKTISLLVNNMYGPLESTDPNKAHALSALIAKFVKAKKLEQQSIEVWGTGIAVREWLYVKDFAEIITKIVLNPEKYISIGPFNIAQNNGLSVKELVNIISERVDYKGEIIYDTSKPDGAPVKVMGDTIFKQVFPEFEFTPIPKGIDETVKYYMSIFPY